MRRVFLLEAGALVSCAASRLVPLLGGTPTVAGSLCDLDGSPLAAQVRVSVCDASGKLISQKVATGQYSVDYPDGARKIVFQRVGGVQSLEVPLVGGTSHVLSPIVPR